MIELVITENSGDFEVVMIDDEVRTTIPGRYWENPMGARKAAKKLEEYFSLCFPWKEVVITRRDLY